MVQFAVEESKPGKKKKKDSVPKYANKVINTLVNAIICETINSLVLEGTDNACMYVG